MQTLKRGDTGTDVQALQQDLVSLGYKVSVDGNYGIQTAAAVGYFQESQGLDSDEVCGPLTWAAIEKKLNKEPVSNKLIGVDTSVFEGAFNWFKGVADGLSFMMTKITEGETLVDSAAPELLSGAKANGIKFRGCYHFFHTKDSVADQVDFFLEKWRQYATEMPPILDLEEASVDGMPYADVKEAAYAWLIAVKQQTSKKPILYVDENMIELLALDERFAEFTLWIAAYSGNPPTKLGPWKNWTFWQYTNKGEQAADTDQFAGTAEDLQALCN